MLVAVALLAAPGQAHAARPHVVGGTAVADGSYPFVASIVFVNPPTDADPTGQFCGGTLIAPQIVLTAASCVARWPISSLRVVLGRRDLRLPGEPHVIDGVTVAADWNPYSGEHDLAVLHLATPSPIVPVRLASTAQTDAATVGVTFGWGAIDAAGVVLPFTLQSVAAPISTTVDAESVLGNTFHAGSEIAAGDIALARVACAGDEGGPLLVGDGVGGFLQIGVFSFNLDRTCGSPVRPGVYARVSEDVGALLTASPVPRFVGDASIVGDGSIGEPLTCRAPVSGVDPVLRYAWFILDDQGDRPDRPITHATGWRYTPVSSLVGSTIYCAVTLAVANGTDSRSSDGVLVHWRDRTPPRSWPVQLTCGRTTCSLYVIARDRGRHRTGIARVDVIVAVQGRAVQVQQARHVGGARYAVRIGALRPGAVTVYTRATDRAGNVESTLAGTGYTVAFGPTAHVVGGGGTAVPYPFVASIVNRARGSYPPFTTVYCTGTLVAPQLVLTSVGCVNGPDYSSTTVVLGRADIRDPGEVHDVDGAVLPPIYDGVRTRQVALLHLTTPSSITPVTLATETQVDGATVGTVLGWGQTDASASVVPFRLQQATVSIANSAAAAALLGRVFDPATGIAVGDVPPTRYACGEDAGGPLLIDDGHGGVVQAALFPGRVGCLPKTVPDIYAAVAPEADWLVDPSVLPGLAHPLTIVGSGAVGNPLVCDAVPTLPGSVITFQWIGHDPDGGVTTITGATTDVHVPTASERGWQLSCEVTVTAGRRSLRFGAALVSVHWADVTPPRSWPVRLTCSDRRCTATIRAEDRGATASGVLRVEVVVLGPGKRAIMRDATRLAGTTYVVNLGRLPPGKVTVQTRATDRAGNRQRVFAFASFRP